MISPEAYKNYAKVKWDDYFYLDGSSPTGLRWKVSRPRSNMVPGAVAGAFVTRVGRNKKKPQSFVRVCLDGNYYSGIVIKQFLTGVEVTQSGEVSTFTESNSQWLSDNPRAIWAAILKHMRTDSIQAEAKAARVMQPDGSFCEDFMQELFTETCLKFNRNYDPSKGKPTTYLTWASRGAVSQALRYRYRYTSRTCNVSAYGRNDEGETNPLVEARIPDFTIKLEELEHKEKIREQVHTIAQRLFTSRATHSDKRCRPHPSSKHKAVFDLQMQGLNLKQIAATLKISRQRVGQYQQWYMRKLKHLLRGKEYLLEA